MKTSILFMVALVFCLGGCMSQNKLVKKAPFEMGQAVAQKQLAGRAESGNMVKLSIPIDSILKEGCTLKSAYYKGKMAKVTVLENDGKKVAVAKFKEGSMQKPDIIMHADPKKEVGNQPPPLNATVELPFEINDDEVVLSYVENEKEKYFKVTGIIEKSSEAFR